MVMETRSRSDHVSSEPLGKKKAKKQSLNSTQKLTKEKNKSKATKCAFDRKVSSKDGHSNRCSKNKIFFLAIALSLSDKPNNEQKSLIKESSS